MRLFRSRKQKNFLLFGALVALCSLAALSFRSIAQEPEALATPGGALSPTSAAAPIRSSPAEETQVSTGPLVDDTVVDPNQEFRLAEGTGLSGNILFSASVDGQERIFVADLDGGRVRRVIDGPGNNSYPSWSPDGREFVFVSDREGSRKLYIARWDGAEPRRLSAAAPSIAEDNPHWSPSGDRIVFYSDSGKEGSDSNLMLIPPTGGVAEPLTRFSGRQTVPKFSPDGRFVSYSTNRFWPGWDVCVFGLRERREKCILSGAQTYCRQEYSPDGKTLAYSFGVFNDIDIGLLDINTGKEKTLTSLPGREYDIAWSPDGSAIAFNAENGQKDLFNTYLSRLSEKTPRALITSPHSIRFLSWTSAKTIDLEVERIREEQHE